MPPRKRKASEPNPPETQAPARVTRSTALSSVRLTRSAAKRPGPPPVFAELPKNNKKKGKKPKQEEGQEPASSNSRTTIVIEHCTQCDSFKTRATELKEGLEAKVPDITVIVNPKKPRKGCFEIREEGGQKFVSLLKMERPFKPMMDLDMDKTISDIVDKISSASLSGMTLDEAR
ncbi:uncharacterized protein LOC133291922 [Gastrolobium bilobum]|uniref:uncharacterized protein LOC133291922 n=1 Tax=Gastrolobium bilobum TaxID=150636 RepID=UPI002AAFD14F|nr:uncharacterized protein LOC133291922 [Gastrolobium bilobum]